jgi:hypothetical protein
VFGAYLVSAVLVADIQVLGTNPAQKTPEAV